jgi:hypothetical protein
LVYFMAIWYILWPFGIYFMAIWYILWPFGIFRGHLVYFTTIWSILWPFGIFWGHMVCNLFFPHFGMLHQEKSGNPCFGLFVFLLCGPRLFCTFWWTQHPRKPPRPNVSPFSLKSSHACRSFINILLAALMRVHSIHFLHA